MNEISIGTIARTACLALALTNQLLSAAGKPVLPIEDSQLEQLVTSGLTVAASLAAWWKNNRFTPAAIKADANLKVYRSADK
ncbi:phage holin [Faecalibacterium sp. An192]|uniref:phage holin n=1 Tax=Faecalibacterium sp. An192 TaxID=1965581 RepID=UPI000B3A8689|nr:phage holin [Faecalibacterium sp. An192]OUP26160.1 phage holin [Faecalibacterium sp. An192]